MINANPNDKQMSTRITHHNLNEARILIVEDDPTLAFALELLLQDAGFQIAGVPGRLSRALTLIEDGACDAALIDAELAGESAKPAALALVARGIPFIVVSGSSLEQQRQVFPAGRCLQKPCRPDDLIRAVRDLFPVR